MWGREVRMTIDVEAVERALPYVAAGGAALAVVLLTAVLIVLARVKRVAAGSPLIAGLDALGEQQLRIEDVVRQEIAQNRRETGATARDSREELTRTLTTFGDSLQSRTKEIASLQQEQLGQFGTQLGTLLTTIDQRLGALTQS